MERIMNEENEWDQNMKTELVEGPVERVLSVVVPIFKGKGDAMSCGAYRRVKLLEHAMKIVEKVLE